MSNPAICVENLGKQYRLGELDYRLRYSTLRDTVMDSVSGLFRRRARSAAAPLFWALRDVGFSVEKGEVVGIIGSNGSGKSTLLKILSGVTDPTEGRAQIRGRVASLLEVGSGFHAELTGRENAYLNGAMLGMTREEVRSRFDEIVAFAGIGQFIDTPVKRYSSGMYMRLAFAVAAHLQPNVLIVDEVLAVGDFKFQQRCLGRMREVSQSGRTVLFVSHNMAAVESLCTRCILLNAGSIVREGEPFEVVREYRRRMGVGAGEAVVLFDAIEHAQRKERVLQRAYVVDGEGEPTCCVPVGRPFEVRIGVDVASGFDDLVFVLRIEDAYAMRILTVWSPANAEYCSLSGRHEIVCRIPHFPLASGEYRLGFAVGSQGEWIDRVDGALSLTVSEGEAFGEGRGARSGRCVAASEWNLLPLTDAGAAAGQDSGCIAAAR